MKLNIVFYLRKIRMIIKLQPVELASVLFCCFNLAFTMPFAYGDLTIHSALIVTSKDSISEVTRSLSQDMQNAGYQVRCISDANLTGPALNDVDLLFVQDSQTLSVNSIDAVSWFLKSGGNIVALRAPLWGQAQRDSYLLWPSPNEPTRILPPGLDSHPAFDPQKIKLEGWTHCASNASNPTTLGILDDPNVIGGKAVNVKITCSTGWDTYASPVIEQPFPPGYEWTVFWAKGDSRTVELAVEWQEKSGARWIATIPLTQNWQPYIIKPGDFHYWTSAAPLNSQQITLSEINRIGFGLAFTHTSSFGGGTHNYQVGPAYTVKPSEVLRKYNPGLSIPKLDILSENYKFFKCNDVSKLIMRADQAIAGKYDLPFAVDIWSCHPRASGNGFAKERSWRWIPLLSAESANGKWRGTPASMLINFDGPYKGGVWVSYTVQDQDWYKNSSVQKSILDIVKRISNRVYLIDGGANFYTYFEKQPVELGLNVANFNMNSEPNLSYAVNVSDSQNQKVYGFTGWLKTNINEVKQTWTPDNWPRSGRKVCITLFQNGKAIDCVAHNINCWKPNKNKQYITVENGKFFLNGKRWRANGVNYMPSSGLGCEDMVYFDRWFNKQSYDPEIVDRDLDIIKDIGLNAVSIFIEHESLSSQNLLDFFYKARQRDLKINISLRPGTPMDFQWDKVRELIEYYKMPENDSIFAYDLAWEPTFGDHNGRREFDNLWANWIIERYGSIENAEKDWDHIACRDTQGRIINPTDEYIVSDGPWTPMVAAYRRFLDTLLYEKYSQARQLVRTLDTHHLVSFRMADAGNPTFNCAVIPYDWPYLAAAVDILEPEAYGRIGTWEQVKHGAFLSYYANWSSSRLPIMWAEVGATAWLRSRMIGDPAQYQFQADYYKDFYKMLIQTGCDGVFFWWYPGGFRPIEQSDYGIVNPDGTDRPVTRIIREFGPSFLNGKDLDHSEPKLNIDRDRHSTGVFGIYSDIKNEFWKALDSGKSPMLVTPASGLDTSNCPLIAVGNKPCNGSNPAKYIDGFIDSVQVKTGNGNWQTVTNDATIEVEPNSTVYGKIAYTNLGEAAWFTSKNDRPGTIGLMIENNTNVFIPIPRIVKKHDNDQLNIILAENLNGPVFTTMSFGIKDGIQFGSKFRLTLKPVRVLEKK